MGRKKARPSVEIIPKARLKAALTGEYAEVLSALEKNLPRLTDREIEEIAERVARKVLEDQLAKCPADEQAAWRERVKEIVYDIGIGLVSSGVWAVLAYAATRILIADGERETEEQREARRKMWDVRSRLSCGLDSETVKDVESFIAVNFSHEFIRERLLAEQLLRAEAFQQHLGALKRLYAELSNHTWAPDADFDRFEASTFVSQVVQSLMNSTHDKIASSGP